MSDAGDVSFGLEVTKGTVAKFLLAGIGFVGTVVFARILGPTGFGGFYLLLAVVQLSKLPVDGVATASKKRFSEANADRGAIAGAIVAVVGIVSLLTVLGVWLARDALVSLSGLSDAPLLFVVLFVSLSLFVPFQGMLTATGRVGLTIWIDLFRSVLTLPLQIVLVLGGFGAAGMAYGLSLATFLSVPVTQYALGTLPAPPDRETFRDLWAFARYSTVAKFLGTAYSRFDVLLLGALLSPAAAGQYEVAMKLTLPAVLLSEVAGDGLMARVSNFETRGQAVAQELTNTLSFTSIVAFPMFFGGLVLAQPVVVTVYGPEYRAAAALLVGLALFRLFETQTGPLRQSLNGLDRPEVNVRASAVTLVLNIVLGVVLTLEYGPIGVVVATVIAEALRYVWLARVLHRQLSDSELLPRTLAEQAGAAVFMAIVVVGLHQVVAVRSWVDLAVLLTAGAVVYGVTLLAASEPLRQTIAAVLGDAGVDVARLRRD